MWLASVQAYHVKAWVACLAVGARKSGDTCTGVAAAAIGIALTTVKARIVRTGVDDLLSAVEFNKKVA